MGNICIPEPPFDADQIIEDVRRTWVQSRESSYPSMVRGTFACNLLEFRDVAAVIAGIKPMALVSLRDTSLLPGEERAFTVARYMAGIATDRGFRLKVVDHPDPRLHGWGAQEWFVGRPESVERARVSWLSLWNLNPRSETFRNHHRVIGECLGIPMADVDWWLDREW